MSNIFSSLFIGTNSLLANKIALDVVGHNLANVNTPGYSRQKVQFTSSIPENTSAGYMGRGVQVDSIIQERNEFFEKDIQKQLSRYGFNLAEKSSFDQLETVINNDQTTGLSTYLTKLFDNFEQLSTSPGNYPMRQSVLYAAQDLTTHIKEIRSNLGKQRADLDLSIKSSIDEINLKLQNIADLNNSIVEGKISGNPNDFIDQRTNLLQELSQKINVTYFTEENGSLTLMIGGLSLVEGNKCNSLVTVPDANNNGYVGIQVKLHGMQEDITDKIKYGELGANLDVRDNKIVNYIADIDKLAKNIIIETNKVHSNGIGLNNFSALTGTYSVFNPDIALNDLQNIGEGYLLFSPQAGNFKVSVTDTSGNKIVSTIDVDPDESLTELAAKIDGIDNITATVNANNQLEIKADSGYGFTVSEDTSYVLAALGLNTFFEGNNGKDIRVNSIIENDTDYITASKTGTSGDGDNALDLAGLRDSKLVDGKSSFVEFYSLIVSKVGNGASLSETSLKATETSLETVCNLRDSVSGVSTDEELANMMQYQRSYEASARFISTINSMIDVLINGLFLG
ncbi:flagellar hook-associated protein FlgK [bacterium]|nr:flagellar hook-associated protein FlgK [bacterium]